MRFKTNTQTENLIWALLKLLHWFIVLDIFCSFVQWLGDESWVCINVNKLKKNKTTNVFLDNVILLKLIS